MYYNITNLSVLFLRLSACHGNAGTENIFNGCRRNAAAEAPYDCTRSLALVSVFVLVMTFGNWVWFSGGNGSTYDNRRNQVSYIESVYQYVSQLL